MKSRQRKKLIKKSLFKVDLASIPDELTLEEWYEFLNKFGLIIYDSAYKADKVEIYPKCNTKAFRYVEFKTIK